jgi:class 3 adenylate cyclase
VDDWSAHGVTTYFRRVLGSDWGFRSLDGHAAVDSPENREVLARFAILMAGAYLVLGNVVLLMVAAYQPDLPGLHLARALAIGLGSLAVLVPSVFLAFRRLPLPLVHLVLPVATTMIVVEGFALGSLGTEAVALGLCITTIEVSIATTRVATLMHLCHLGAGYLLLVSIQPGHPNPAARFVGIFGGVVVVGVAVGRLVDRVRQLALSERAATERATAAQEQLAVLNATLEVRVSEQVAELDRLSELERFLPSAVVDAVVGDARELLEPHRSEIAVLFCDLRGFTAFSTAAQPEEVHELLDAYFAVLGEHAQRHGATIGAFTGDGMMAFFNDPLPVEDPCGRALAMAQELQVPVHALLARWRRVGHDVGFGVGIALGYANIGMIGFEGRRDYTALGPVVNLAARLCADGPYDGILLDPRAAVAVDGRVPLGEPVAMHLPGFERTIEAFPVRSSEA